MTFSKYLRYVDQNIAWLPSMPAHWEITPFRSCASITAGQVQPADLNYQQWNLIAPNHIESGTGKLLGRQTAAEQGAISGKYLVRPGEIVYSKIRPNLNKVWIADEDCLCSADMYPIQVNERARSTYLFYLMLSKPFANLMASESMRVAMPKVNRETLSAVRFVLPPIVEQIAITRFLNVETAESDALIDRYERLISLLEEKRTTLIANAVTKGLDGDVAMKDSEIDWMGRIPSHWKVVPLRTVARLKTGHTPSRNVPEYWENCTIPWVSLSDVGSMRDGSRDYIQETKECISELGLAHSAAELLPAGAVILSRTASVGYAAMIKVRMATTQDFVNWICGDMLEPLYLLNVFRGMKQEFGRLTNGSVHQTIYMPDVVAFRVPLPPTDEQRAIGAFISEKSGELFRSIASVKAALALVKERRASIIAAAVTGQIDVRERRGSFAAKEALV